VVVVGSAIGTSRPALLKSCEKSPFTCAGVGTVVILGLVTTRRYSSKLLKKNVLSCRIGPPTAPPNWLRLNGGRGLPIRFWKKSLAFKTLLRQNSYAVPWNW